MHARSDTIRVGVIVAMAMVAASSTFSPAAHATTSPTAAPSVDACGRSSWVAGTVDLCAGELVYRDYVYDDYGANRPVRAVGGGAPNGPAPTGDERYAGAHPNTADLLALRLRVDEETVHVQFELNSLFIPESTTAAIAIDTDDDVTTGGGPWPGVGVSSRGWDVVASWSVGDVVANTISGTMPRPPGSRWRLQAVTAIAGGPVMNVAFREQEQGVWWEDRQAAALQTGDISDFGHAVEVADLTGGVTRPADEPASGLFERVYTSQHTIPPGEGISYDGVPGRTDRSPGRFPQLYHFFGRHQPYAIYLPPGEGPHGVQLYLHGRGGNHGNEITKPGLRSQLGDSRNRIVAAPLGRGQSAWTDYGELDVLEVLDDVQRTYDTDPDRVFVSGYSMGGYGTVRMATLHPDRFAGYVNWMGPTGDEYNGTPLAGQLSEAPIGVIDILGNLRNLPGIMAYAAEDELVLVPQAIEMESRLRAHSNPYRFYLYPVADHVILPVLDDWSKESAYTKDLSRDRDPARVTFRYDPWFDSPDLGIVHDRAYWVSAIRNRTTGYSDTDVTSAGCEGTVPVTTIVKDVGTTPLPWVSTSAEVTGHRAVDQPSLLRGTFTNVESVTLDVGLACLADRDVTFEVTSDGPLELRLSDGRAVQVGEGTTTGVIEDLSA